MKPGDKCPHCGKGILIIILEDFPYTIDHLMCDQCDSTYCLEEERKANENNKC